MLKSCPEVVSVWEAQARAQKPCLDSGPGLLIGCGRRAATCSKKIRSLQPSRWTNIQILDPRTKLAGFDWVLAPYHDRMTEARVINYLAALTEFDDLLIEHTRQQSAGFGDLVSPRIVLLVGGPTRRASWKRSDLKGWLGELELFSKEQGGTAMVLNSRRTPLWANRMLARFTKDSPHFYSHDAKTNRYAAALSFADMIWVTGDSVNMLSEACSTRKPVRALGTDRLRGKIRLCWQQLSEAGRLLENWQDPPSGQYTPLREASRVAEQLRRRGALLGIE